MKAIKKPALPQPNFRYGSRSYVLLSYAKFKREAFGIEDVRKFSYRFDDAWSIKQSIKTLISNGSLEQVSSDSWKITPKGVQQVYDFAARNQVIKMQAQQNSAPQTKR